MNVTLKKRLGLALALMWLVGLPAAASRWRSDIASLPSDVREVSVVVEHGDSLSKLFRRVKVPINQMYAVLELGEPVKSLKHLLPGQKLLLIVGQNNRLYGLSMAISHSDRLEVIWRDGHFVANVSDVQRVASTHFVQFDVKHSVFEDGKRAGLSHKLLSQLTKIFSWQVDMAKEVQPGDHFNVLYQEYLTGTGRGEQGDIVDIHFKHHGEVLRATQFTDSHGITDYYDPQGFSLARSFLRAPLTYRRISSKFNPRRRHPILHVLRPHWGVDFAAPRGTKIYASGQGRVIFVGPRGGYGREIEIRHNAHYVTVYGHLSRFAKGLHIGQIVKQRQLIGYVGSTGLATGPHLHYEVRINGKPKDPLTVTLPSGRSLHGMDRMRFASSLYQWSSIESTL